ncbi:MAG: FAD-dependent thymidylate synthase [Burkholderiales bacterium]
MSVRLVAITKPVIAECQEPGDLLAYCARVSNPANQANTETAPQLISYLVRNQHWSPFEMASMTLEIRTTRDIARQILRHRSFSFQEFSQRYAQVVSPPVIREARMQDSKNRQASHDVDDALLQARWAAKQEHVANKAAEAYAWALEHGLAKEVARCVLPEGNTESILYMAGTVRSWIHYVQMRTEAGTQKEHRGIALAARLIVLDHFPALTEVLK